MAREDSHNFIIFTIRYDDYFPMFRELKIFSALLCVSFSALIAAHAQKNSTEDEVVSILSDKVAVVPAVLTLDHNNLVHEKLAPLQAFLDLNAAELKKIVLLLPAKLVCFGCRLCFAMSKGEAAA